MGKQVIVLVGPTASGKTALAVQLSQKLAAPIINADSRQVYRELGVAVAKPSPAERAAAPHHLLDYVSIHEPYSAGRWSRDARAKLAELFDAGSEYCIVSGGAGLHIRALLDGLPEMPAVAPEIRADVEQVFAKAGLPHLQAEVKRLDPAYYAEVDAQNPHRLMRAIAVMRSSGQRFSALRKQAAKPLPYATKWIILQPPRDELYSRINARVDAMVQAGLEAEAATLYPHRDLDALNTIGYKEWWPYIEGGQSHERTVELVAQHSRQYARRQLTWNRKLTGLTLANPSIDAATAFVTGTAQ